MRPFFISTFAAPLVLSVITAHVGAGTYTNEASFVSAIQANPYIEDFTGFTYGSPFDGLQPSPYVAPGANGYGWTATAPGNLYSTDSALSTNLSGDPLTFAFTGTPVTALGANITVTDLEGNVVDGTASIQLSDGTTEFVTNQSLTSFWGYTSAVPITSVTFNSTNDQNFVQVDHFYSAAAALPEPASLGLLALSGIFFRTRVRRA